MIYSIRLIQELAYIYEYDEIIDEDGTLKIDGVILFLGAMFGAQGEGSLIRIASSNSAKYASKKIMTTALMKTAWYPLLKIISKVVASKALTKKTLAGIATKAVPIIGGITSGGLTAFTMSLATKNLNAELIKGYNLNYNEEIFTYDVKFVNLNLKKLSKEKLLIIFNKA